MVFRYKQHIIDSNREEILIVTGTKQIRYTPVKTEKNYWFQTNPVTKEEYIKLASQHPEATVCEWPIKTKLKIKGKGRPVGYKMSNKSKRMLSESNAGKNTKPCIAAGTKYPSVKEAATALGLNYQTVLSRLRAGRYRYDQQES
jgi:hypothetical protein